MFTGLVEEVGTLKSVQRKGEAMVLDIQASVIMEDLKLGDSIAVNGVCLTAVSNQGNSFAVDVMPETYRHTNLSALKVGGKVNLERAMAAGGRFGGHIVQGHVDGTGTITGVTRDQNAVVYDIAPSQQSLFKYIIPQGSITIDGISLTVVRSNGEKFSVSIIPHTLAETALSDKRAGDTVNLECDVLGKYVEHLLNYGSREKGMEAAPNKQGVGMQFLIENGFA
ncbi:riboflavin synthase [Paenibacillus sp. YPG26]|uniref:riboflavin synthase n=1 Tax=Paenibacillus sp. YPG26 TaxID=2878915 RepID=UPI0020419C6E|nr:riboflavin synthase [Paenibacillus sp. YPG26]USB34727.1 riboflavin synthase [Paenibacillus sp. YPG26]